MLVLDTSFFKREDKEFYHRLTNFKTEEFKCKMYDQSLTTGRKVNVYKPAKISKPRLRRSFTGLWQCEGGYTTYSLCPIKAYKEWLAKEQAEPYHLYSDRTMKELLERLDKHKEENPEKYEKKYYSDVGLYKHKEPDTTLYQSSFKFVRDSEDVGWLGKMFNLIKGLICRK